MRGDIRIGQYLVQAPLSRVVCGDREASVEPKVMDVLVHLAEHQGEVCSKEQILTSVWADTFVTDDVLKHAIFELRKAFQDDAQNPAYIRTIPRRGYQLVAEVSGGDGDRYRIIEKLGEGAMGEVWLAGDHLLHRKVALKLLPEGEEEEESARRLLREARAAAALDHPYICKVHDTGKLDGRSYIAMEYVRGQTLKERLDEGPLTLDEALKLGCEIAEAMEDASEKGFVHRDLKPSNLMLSELGHVKVMDFGVAKRLKRKPEDDWTLTGSGEAPSVGTLPYMSPEQVKEGDLDSRSDIFSLGVVLYEALTGIRLFRKPSPMETGSAILNEDPPSLSVHLGDGYPQLEHILTRMLAKDPECRHQSFNEVRRDLDEAASLNTPSSTLKVPWRNYKKHAFAGFGAIAVVATALLLWDYFDRSAPGSPALPVPLTSFRGSETTPALSPDGAFLAYAWNGEEQKHYDIYAQVIGTSEPRRMTTDPADDRYPTWSPDGSQIAFLRSFSATERSVFMIPALGDSEVRLADLEPGYFWGFDGKRISWSPNGRVLAVAEGGPGGEPDRIFLLSLETREKEELLVSAQDAWFGCPVFSPDGGKLAYIQYTSDVCRLCFQTIYGGDSECLAPFPFFIWDMDWTQDGAAIVYAAGAGPHRRLWIVHVDGGESKLLPFGVDALRVSIARNGGRLAYEVFEQDMSLWQAGVPTTSRDVAPTRFTASSTRIDRFPQFSPDGNKVLFESTRTGPYQLWISNADGSSPRQLTSRTDMWPGAGMWSPTGDRVVFHAYREGRDASEVYVVESTGGTPICLTPDEFSDSDPCWSPDGHWIHYRSDRGEHRGIFKVPSIGGEPELLLEGRVGGPRELNENLLLYGRGGKIWRLDLNTGEESLVLDREFDSWTTWKGNLVYSYGNQEEGQGPVLEKLDPATGQTRELLRLEKGNFVGMGMTVSPNGESILFSQFKILRSDLMLVENSY